MFKRFCLAAAVAIAGMVIGGQSEAKADYCYRGGGYGRPVVNVGVYGSPYSAYRYAAPRPIYTSPYRSGFGYGYGFGPPVYRSARPVIYGSPYYNRGTTIGVGRGGFSIGFGF